MSLRVRLLLAVGAVALLALAAADIATYSWLRRSLYQRVDQSLETAHFPVEQELRPGPGDFNGGRFLTVAPGTFVEVRAADDSVVGIAPVYEFSGHTVVPNLPAHIGGLSQSSGPGEPLRYFSVSSPNGGPRFRIRVSSLGGGQLILGLPLTDTLATLHRLVVVELSVTAAALAVAIGLGFWLVRVGLQPLADVEATAVAIAEGELDRRVPGDDANTEVGQVARALNTMLGRIEDAFAERDATLSDLRRSEERLRRFVGDASHELRTPLAAVSAYAQLFERGAKGRPEDLARVMAGIRSETARMGHLVDDLLLLARLDEGRPLERKPVDLVDLVTEAVETASAVGPEWPLRLDAPDAVHVIGDGTRLRQVIDNLLANVRAHTPPGTPATVRVGTSGEDAVVEVADEGPGLTAEQADKVFERFYRADPSRSRQHGGSGLGLGIVAAIVAAHGGTVAASPGAERGAVFTVRLPLARRDMDAAA
jgi:two-component system, OmpR family, sensor kinase